VEVIVDGLFDSLFLLLSRSSSTSHIPPSPMVGWVVSRVRPTVGHVTWLQLSFCYARHPKLMPRFLLVHW